jgi:hypothetical protein
MFYKLVGHVTARCNMAEFAYYLENHNRIVKVTEVAPDVIVSTVFLGLDHSFSAQSQPVLFETMIFGGVRDEEQLRYRTWDEAVEGHDAIVASFRQRCQSCNTLRTGEQVKCPSCGDNY